MFLIREEDAVISKWKGTLSGWHFGQFPILHTQCAGMPVSILNDGRQMVMQLDDNGIRFIQHGLTEIIKKLSVGDVDASTRAGIKDDSEIAGFKFDDSTPNISEKVVWDTDKNSWKVTYKIKNKPISTYVDHLGKSLSVSTDVSSETFLAIKSRQYAQAVEAWNKLDKSTRHKIARPLLALTIDLNSPSKASSSDLDAAIEHAQEDDSPPASDSPLEPLTLMGKWESDASQFF